MTKEEQSNSENNESISEEQLKDEELTMDKVEKILMSFEERLKILELKTGLRTYN